MFIFRKVMAVERDDYVYEVIRKPFVFLQIITFSGIGYIKRNS